MLEKNKSLLIRSLNSSAVVAGISGIAGCAILVQDILMAARFAIGPEVDAYQLAISFPVFALNIFAGGTILAVLVPILVKLQAAGRIEEESILLKNVRIALAVILFCVCMFWVLVYPKLMTAMAQGFTADTMILSNQLLWLVLPLLFFAGLASADSAVLSSRKHFVFISFLPAFMPAGVVLGLLLLGGVLGIYAAALGLLLGSVAQWLASRLMVSRLLPNNHGQTQLGSVISLPKVLRDYAMAALSAALLAGIVLTDTLLASTLAEGSAAIYNFATRPVVLLLAFATIVVANAALPIFSQLVALQDWVSLKKLVVSWFGLLALGSVPFVALWYVFAVETVALLYQRGEFDLSDTLRVSAVLQVYLVHAPFFLVGVIGWRLMNSLNMHLALLIVSGMAFIVNLIADLWWLNDYGLLGIAWGTNLAFIIWAALILVYLLVLQNKFISKFS